MTGGGIRLDAEALADLTGVPAPTDEQRAVIEAVPDAVHLVIAGAGSGKTETMAGRVGWLVANEHVSSAGVLGLTFTRRAATELEERIRTRLECLARGLGRPLSPDPFDTATVQTYNAFAASITREHGARIGQDPDASVLSEASAWQLARRVVAESSDPRLLTLDRDLDAVTGATLELSRALTEHLVAPDAVRAFAAEFVRLVDAPLGGHKRVSSREMKDMVAAVGGLDVLLDLAGRYEAEKRARGCVEFADQVALAVRICREHPDVVAELRQRYRVVLLDEYQDTSVPQCVLLGTLFRGGSVMAVGDPDQAIYGWRGASASNLATFHADFALSALVGAESALAKLPAAAEIVAAETVEEVEEIAPKSSAAEAVTGSIVATASTAGAGSVFPLGTSWRNPAAILKLANAVVAAGDAPTVPKPQLRPGPHGHAGRVVTCVLDTLAAEADAVADWFAQELRPESRSASTAVAPTAAMLVRTTRHVPVFVAALRARAVPVQVLGMGGLLEQPAVVDLVSALTVLDDPTAGAELVRLLAGGRWRIGTADLAALGDLARKLQRCNADFRPLDGPVAALLRGSLEPSDTPALVAALDFVVTRPDDDAAFTDIMPVGRARMRDAGKLLRRLRAHRDLPLGDLVHFVAQELHLDLEADANETQPLAGPNLTAFQDLVSGFEAHDEHGGLGRFLAWLQLAAKHDRLAPRSEPSIPGTVQVLTMHGAKGLEWDLVAVPRLVEDVMPLKPRTNRGWVTFGALPHELRGDHAHLPEFAWRAADTQQEVEAEYARFRDATTAHSVAEERRLFYVAVTRAREALHLSASWWATQRTPREPSRFLRELADRALIPRLPDSPVDTIDPVDEGEPASAEPSIVWPTDPLGDRRPTVTAAATAVRQAMARASAGAPLAMSAELAADLTLLLAERDAVSPPLVAPRVRLAASRIQDVLDDPLHARDTQARPMPRRPSAAAAIGTRFHAWVEDRARTGEDPDGLGFDLPVPQTVPDDTESAGSIPTDHDGAQERLADLQRRFGASQWANQRPLQVELELLAPFAGHLVVCRIDAVFAVDPETPLGRTGVRFQVVDWKTGSRSENAKEHARRQVQLALYRAAFADWMNVSRDIVDAVCFDVATGHVSEDRNWPDPDDLMRSLDAASERAVSRRTGSVDNSVAHESVARASAVPDPATASDAAPEHEFVAAVTAPGRGDIPGPPDVRDPPKAPAPGANPTDRPQSPRTGSV